MQRINRTDCGVDLAFDLLGGHIRIAKFKVNKVIDNDFVNTILATRKYHDI